MKAAPITLIVQAPNWRKARGLPQALKAAARASLAASGLPPGAHVTILLADNECLRTLNRAFRGKDRPTNVLSFPAAANREGHAGDIALAYGVARDEARAAGKPVAHHAAHLVVHGMLHLAGFDHRTRRDAAKMEGLEVKILSRLGIADPYATAGR
jgi:probable rRNA maturation factor